MRHFKHASLEMMRQLAIALALALCVAPTYSAPPRSKAAVNAFKRANPCPSTGKPRGSCPGYVVDHVVPLCANGPDEPSNMQWQTVEAAKVKDRQEKRQCRN